MGVNFLTAGLGSYRSTRKKKARMGIWVPQSVECLTLDFGSVDDPRVMGSSLILDFMLSMEHVWDSLSLSLSLSLSFSLCLILPLSHCVLFFS